MDDDGNRHGRFSSRYGNHKQGEKQSIQLSGIKVFIEGNEIQIYAVQNQLDTHKHRNQVAPDQKPIHPDEEQDEADG
jgi:hypothetical protein